MALLPGYRYLGTHERLPKTGVLADFGDAGTRCVSSSGKDFARLPDHYMVPIARTRKPYTPRETSLEAYKSQKDKAPVDAAKILAYIIKEDQSDGATCDEIEVSLSLSHQTASARVRDLFQGGLIMDSGLRRKTRTGRKATVWRVVLP